MSDSKSEKREFTRRQLLKGIPIGIAGAAALGLVSDRLASAFTRRKRAPNLPQDSIFAPDPNRSRRA